MIRMRPKALAVAAALMGLGIVADQVTKAWAAARLPGSPLEVIPGALTFAYVENRNAAFGLGSQLPESVKVWILIGLTCALTLALTVAMLRSEDLASQIGFGTTVCGAVGNIIDRISLGYVRDFIFWHGGFNWPNFNVADMLVCVGVGVLVFLGGKKSPKAEPEKSEAARDRAATP